MPSEGSDDLTCRRLGLWDCAVLAEPLAQPVDGFLDRDEELFGKARAVGA
eukprot:CAMPEP_0174698470 /NCGR_PEP_ID=MMETSP1094-20130205/4067_1 /TAXON_ID=156173 /ORGANISM="Chrysochromulina brevifilum, Strain UTEX LB 985" /LENGTH=49 /DNA_ID=CAMNT_0015895659 /DNA_START=252 /DNA_END=401 /DNA_ORIENTATION=+